MLALLIANFGTTTAEFSGVAAAFSLAHVPAWACVPPVAIGVWLLVTRGSYRKVERVFLALTAVYVAYFIAGFLAKPDWHAAMRGTVIPHVQTEQPLDPHGDRRDRHNDHALGPVLHPGVHRRQAHLDHPLRVHQGRGVHGRGVHRRDRPVHRARLRRDAVQGEHRHRDRAGRRPRARARSPGRRRAFLFGFGLLNVSILGAAILPLTTAYAVCEAFGFESGLDKKFDEAPAFNGILTTFIAVPALVAIIPHLPLVKVMLLSQDVNGILLPIILIYVLKIINDPQVMGDHVNGKVYNTIAWAFSAVLIGLSVTLVAVAAHLLTAA